MYVHKFILTSAHAADIHILIEREGNCRHSRWKCRKRRKSKRRRGRGRERESE